MVCKLGPCLVQVPRVGLHKLQQLTVTEVWRQLNLVCLEVLLDFGDLLDLEVTYIVPSVEKDSVVVIAFSVVTFRSWWPCQVCSGWGQRVCEFLTIQRVSMIDLTGLWDPTLMELFDFRVILFECVAVVPTLPLILDIDVKLHIY